MEDGSTLPPEQSDAASSASSPSILAWLLLTSRAIDAMLDVLVTLARGTMARVDGASLSVIRHGRFENAAAFSDGVLEADRVQYDSGQGPCIQATRVGETINVALAETKSRWPEFAETAVSAGYRSVLSTPLRTGGRFTGAMTLYSQGTTPFDEDHMRAARAFADQAELVLDDAAALADVAAFGAADTLHRRLSEAVLTRDIVGWATGIFMGGRHCSPDDAFDILRRTSKQSGRTLRDVASDVVATAQLRQSGNR